MAEAFCVHKFVSSVSMNKDVLIPDNTSGCDVPNRQLRGELSIETKSILGTIYLTAVVLGTFGNLLAILTVLLNKRMQTAGNLLLLNLSVSDLIVTMICMPVIFGYQVLSYPNWPHSKGLCKVSKFLVQLSVFCSILTLISISIHRYFVLHSPLKTHLVCIKQRHLFVVYWVCAFGFTVPTGISTQLIYISNQSIVRLLCVEVYNSKEQELLYLSLRLSTYLATVLVLSCLHSWIVMKLWKNRRAGLDQSRLNDIKIAVKLLLAATIVFCICWLPYAIQVFLAISRPNGYELRRGFDIFGNFLGMANSVLNPYIYCYYSKSFRTGFRDILESIRRYIFMCKTHSVEPAS